MIFNIPVGCPKTTITVYGAAGETVTLTHSNGTVYTFTANDGSTKTILTGVYTVKGSVSGYSKSATVTTSTTRIDAWPNNATIYYWYGYAPIGEFSSIAALPNTSPHTSNAVAPNITPSTNSVYIKTRGDSSRGGTAYLPKATLKGSKLYLTCSDAYQKGNYNSYLALNVTNSVSNNYTPAAVVDIAEGTTSKTLDISAISGGSYHVAMSANTSHRDGGSKQSYITIKALYSV